jgi:hypothetical protein
VANGYSTSQVNKVIRSVLHSKYKNSHSSSPPLALIYLPYIQGIIDHVYNILGKNNIKTLFKHHKTLKQLFRTTRDKYDPMLGQGVYKIPYAYGKS